MVKLLSAITESCSSKRLSKPETAVSFLLEMLPPYKSDTKDMAPAGSRRYCYKGFKCVMILVIRKCKLLSGRVLWLFNKNFCSINDAPS